MSQIRAGIIGAGIGQAHLKGYLQVPEAKVVAICDQNEERARKLAADFDIDVEIYTNHRDMIEKAGLDPTIRAEDIPVEGFVALARGMT